MKGTHFMLSSLPLNACFFCGVGGPETVVEIFLTNPITYTDKPVEIKGKLILNDKDPDKMIYQLIAAEFLGVVEF
jgi:superfamily II helicase